MMTRPEAEAIYDAGKKAVVRVLLAMDARIDVMQERIRHLENQLAMNSSNSSKPPSSDGYKKPAPKSLRKKGERKSGGQPGHKGNTLKPVKNPDRVEHHRVVVCTCCEKMLADVIPTKIEKRQVFDLPPLRLEVTEHQAETKVCSCGHINKAAFPTGVNAPTQYGPDIKVIANYIKNHQHIPYARACELLSDLFGAAISQGTLASMLFECASLLEKPLEEIKKQVTEALVLHLDETGMRVENKGHWMHTASTQTATYYHIHNRRGTVAIDENGILPNFTGYAVHDHLKAYLTYDCNHALCNAHHLRELIFVHEQYDQPWAQEMIDCLLKIKEVTDQAQLTSTQLSPQKIKELEDLYQQAIANGYAQNPLPPPPEKKKRGRTAKTKPRNLLERLDKFREQTLAFMYNANVPFDNNLAERDLRMIKIQQKISGTFRTMSGARTFSSIRSYLSTARKNGIGAFDALTALYAGHPFIPSKKL